MPAPEIFISACEVSGDLHAAAVLAIEAGRTLFVQREESLALLDAHRGALWGCTEADARA